MELDAAEKERRYREQQEAAFRKAEADRSKLDAEIQAERLRL